MVSLVDTASPAPRRARRVFSSKRLLAKKSFRFVEKKLIGREGRLGCRVLCPELPELVDGGAKSFLATKV